MRRFPRAAGALPVPVAALSPVVLPAAVLAILLGLALVVGFLLSPPAAGSTGEGDPPSVVEEPAAGDPLVVARSTGLKPLLESAGRIGLLAEEGLVEAVQRLRLVGAAAADLGSRHRAASEALDRANRLLAEQVHLAGELRIDYRAVVERLDASDRSMLEVAHRTRRNTSAVVRVLNLTDWVCPVIGEIRFSDTWGEPRSGGRTHDGVDLAAPANTPLVAPVAGRVTYRWDTIGGRSYDLVADNGDYYFGTHMRGFGIEGRVRAGDVIGYMGADGNAEAVHLHFEYHPGGKGNSVNPYPLVDTHCTNRRL